MSWTCATRLKKEANRMIRGKWKQYSSFARVKQISVKSCFGAKKVTFDIFSSR